MPAAGKEHRRKQLHRAREYSPAASRHSIGDSAYYAWAEGPSRTRRRLTRPAPGTRRVTCAAPSAGPSSRRLSPSLARPVDTVEIATKFAQRARCRDCGAYRMAYPAADVRASPRVRSGAASRSAPVAHQTDSSISPPTTPPMRPGRGEPSGRRGASRRPGMQRPVGVSACRCQVGRWREGSEPT